MIDMKESISTRFSFSLHSMMEEIKENVFMHCLQKEFKSMYDSEIFKSNNYKSLVCRILNDHNIVIVECTQKPCYTYITRDGERISPKIPQDHRYYEQFYKELK